MNAKQVKPEEIASGEAVVGLVNALAKKAMHTPGPWVADSYSVWSKATDSRPGVRLCSVDWLKFQDGSGLNSRAAVSSNEAISNARLMASAPEMLEALENLFVQLEQASPQTRRELNYNELESVIRKAKGLNNE